jgi:hypothetical protein
MAFAHKQISRIRRNGKGRFGKTKVFRIHISTLSGGLSCRYCALTSLCTICPVTSL